MRVLPSLPFGGCGSGWKVVIASMVASLPVACGSPREAATTIPEPDQNEIAAIQRVVDLTYEASSFTDARTADPEDFREPFTANARLAYVSDGELVVRSVDEYVEIRRGIMESGDIASLEEWELEGRTEFFGDIAHRISSYAVRIDGAAELAERGVMSFQLVRVGGVWRVHSLTWHAESDVLDLPQRFLPMGEGTS